MLAFSEIIDFLLNLMRDESARAEFEQDPQGTLARAGLEGVTGQDISDARLQLADSGAVAASADGGGGAAGRRPTRTTPTRSARSTTPRSTTTSRTPGRPPADGGDAPELNLLPQNNPGLSIDDRDSFFFQTFNSDDDVTIIDDSFNTIDNSSTDVALTNIEATNSFNEARSPATTT